MSTFKSALYCLCECLTVGLNSHTGFSRIYDTVELLACSECRETSYLLSRSNKYFINNGSNGLCVNWKRALGVNGKFPSAPLSLLASFSSLCCIFHSLSAAASQNNKVYSMWTQCMLPAQPPTDRLYQADPPQEMEGAVITCMFLCCIISYAVILCNSCCLIEFPCPYDSS